MFLPFISQQPTFTYITILIDLTIFIRGKSEQKFNELFCMRGWSNWRTHIWYATAAAHIMYVVCTFSYILVCRYIFRIYIKNKKNFLPDFSALYIAWFTSQGARIHIHRLTFNTKSPVAFAWPAMRQQQQQQSENYKFASL